MIKYLWDLIYSDSQNWYEFIDEKIKALKIPAVNNTQQTKLHALKQ